MTRKQMADSEPLPMAKGPKLHPFLSLQDLKDIEFRRVLSTEGSHSQDEVPHGRVFEVRIGGKRYALKVFNFFSLEEIRPLVPMREHLLEKKDNLVRHHLDPFFRECRAFGRLVVDGKDDKLAVRCYGYAYLSEDMERQIEEKFGIYDWNRGVEDEDRPLRAIVKDYIYYKIPFGRKPCASFPKMRETLEALNNLGIFNMDIRKENYRNGRLFDFSLAITSPNLLFWPKLYGEEWIMEAMDEDLECFDAMVEEYTKIWLGRLRSVKK